MNRLDISLPPESQVSRPPHVLGRVFWDMGQSSGCTALGVQNGWGLWPGDGGAQGRQSTSSEVCQSAFLQNIPSGVSFPVLIRSLIRT